jgi:solute carrier family 30 (zinc transporter), member 2
MEQSDKIVISKLKKIAIISLIFMAIEIAGGILAHSIAILADAFHLLSDVFAYSISLYAVLLSKKIAPDYMGFGYEKAQPLGALINVAIIWAVTIGLFIEATKRIIDKEVVEEPLYMLLTSIFGLGCNLFIMRTLHSDETVPCAHSHNHSHDHGSKPKKEITARK